MHLHALHVSMGTHEVCSVNPGVNKTTMTGDVSAHACACGVHVRADS